MAQQQLLLIILALIIIGIAVAVGIGMFSDGSVSANRDAISSDLINMSARAHEYYHKPVNLGGGGKTFVGLTADAEGISRISNLPDGKNANGAYSIYSSGSEDKVVLEGVGTEVVSGGNHVTLRMIVQANLSDSIYQVY